MTIPLLYVTQEFSISCQDIQLIATFPPGKFVVDNHTVVQ